MQERQNKTHEKRQDVLPAEHVSGHLRLRQPPFAEQAHSVRRKFAADAGRFVLDEELFTCSGGRSGSEEK